MRSAEAAAASSLAVLDLYEPMFGKHATEQQQIFHSRVITAIFAAAALATSLVFPGVVSLVVFATLISPAAIFVPFILSIFWKNTPRHAGFYAVIVAAIAGCTSQILWYEKLDWWLGLVHPLFVAPAAALTVMLLGTLRSRST